MAATVIKLAALPSARRRARSLEAPEAKPRPMRMAVAAVVWLALAMELARSMSESAPFVTEGWWLSYSKDIFARQIFCSLFMLCLNGSFWGFIFAPAFVQGRADVFCVGEGKPPQPLSGRVIAELFLCLLMVAWGTVAPIVLGPVVTFVAFGTIAASCFYHACLLYRGMSWRLFDEHGQTIFDEPLARRRAVPPAHVQLAAPPPRPSTWTHLEDGQDGAAGHDLEATGATVNEVAPVPSPVAVGTQVQEVADAHPPGTPLVIGMPVRPSSGLVASACEEVAGVPVAAVPHGRAHLEAQAIRVVHLQHARALVECRDRL